MAEAREPTDGRQLGLERELGRKDADERAAGEEGVDERAADEEGVDAQQSTDAQEELAVAGSHASLVGALLRQHAVRGVFRT